MTSISNKFNKLLSGNQDDTWAPKSLDHLLDEIQSIKEISEFENSLILYRGQTNIDWPVESTFLRNSIPLLFNINNYVDLPAAIRKRSTFHRSIASLLLLKFDQIIKPSDEAYQNEQTHDIDPYFELLKNVQQYPERYEEVNFINGTNLIDWTYVFHIALYFCTIAGVGRDRKVSHGNGVLYLFNASATGKIHQTIKTQQLFDNMTSSLVSQRLAEQ